jgi:hypothetical protein
VNAPLAVALAAVIVGFLAVVAVVHMEGRRLRDEQTANRIERAELLNRIQAPHHVAANPTYGSSPRIVPDLHAPPADPEDADIEREWGRSPESIVPFDDDLVLADE